MDMRTEAEIITTAAIIADNSPAPTTKKGWLQLLATWFLIGFFTELICSMFDSND